MNYIVVPDGIATDELGFSTDKPSFVFRQILDYLLNIIKSEDIVYIAPANNFSGGIYEQEIAYHYLVDNLKTNIENIKYPIIITSKHIDTFGNALYLKSFLGRLFYTEKFDLICAYIHSFRAELCFRYFGYNIATVHRIKYKITKENIVGRLWYYKYRYIHMTYEMLAILRDLMKLQFR